MKKRSLSKIDIFSIVLGSIIGWGAFMLPGTKFLKEAGVINTFLGIVLGVICIIIIEKNYSIMMRIHDEEGGEFSYAYNNLGKKHGFFVGWFLSITYFTMIPLNATAFPLIIKKLFGNVLEIGYLYNIAEHNVYLGEIVVSCIIILIFAIINLNGINKTSSIQNIIIFMLIIIVIIIGIAMFINGNKEKFFSLYINDYFFDLNQILKVFTITPFAFIGFDVIPQLSKEFKFSKKKASIVAIFSLIVSGLIYNVLNIITALEYTPKEAIALEWALGSAVLKTLGKGAFVLLIISLCAAVCSGINGFMICSSKLLGAMANYKMLPKNISNKNKNGVFGNAIKFITIISLISPWLGRGLILWIVEMASLGASITYCYISFIAIKKNKSKLIPLTGVSIGIIFILLLLLPNSPAHLSREAMVVLIIWSLIGILLYYRFDLKIEKEISYD